MTIKEKLEELIGQVQDDGCDYSDCFTQWDRPRHIENSVLVDYLINHGVTVLPYKVGDKLYYIDRHINTVEEDTIKFITITKNGPKPILTRHNARFWEYYVFGVNVFLTKEEATAAAIKNNICT
jgi:uncharacterized membrane protein